MKDLGKMLRQQAEAREALRACNVPIGADFHTLPASIVENLLAQADRVKYRKPKNANGSRGRYFHAMLQRRARDRAYSDWI